MRRTQAMMMGAMLLMGLMAPGTAAAGAPGAVTPSPGWHGYPVPVTGHGVLDAVTATGRDDVWAGGMTIPSSGGSSCNGVPFPSLMLHWNGSSWRRVKVPNVRTISGLSAADASDVWATAPCGVLHWNGSAWARVRYPVPPGAQQPAADQVEADQPGDAWLFGTTYDAKTQVEGAFIDHWHGQRWSRVPLPRLGKYSGLEAIAARGPSRLSAVVLNFAGSVAKPPRPDAVFGLDRDGKHWTKTASLNTGMRTVLINTVTLATGQAGPGGGVWATGFGKVWPAGNQARHPLALRWNGRGWDETPMPSGPGELYQLAQAGRELWAVGDTYSPTKPSYTMDFLRWAGTRWVHAPVPLTGEGSLIAATADPSGGLWAVGSTGSAGTSRPVIELWN